MRRQGHMVYSHPRVCIHDVLCADWLGGTLMSADFLMNLKGFVTTRAPQPFESQKKAISKVYEHRLTRDTKDRGRNVSVFGKPENGDVFGPGSIKKNQNQTSPKIRPRFEVSATDPKIRAGSHHGGGGGSYSLPHTDPTLT